MRKLDVLTSPDECVLRLEAGDGWRVCWVAVEVEVVQFGIQRWIGGTMTIMVMESSKMVRMVVRMDEGGGIID